MDASNPIRIMIDIETLSTREDAHVLSIGAVTITPSFDIEENKFYRVCANKQDRHIDPATVEWWMKNAANYPFVNNNTCTLSEVLWQLYDYISRMALKYNKEFRGDYVEVWAKGSDFDIRILSHACNSYGAVIPWRYNAVRDLRTFAKLFPQIKKHIDEPSHNALDDAYQQAKWLIDLLKYREEVYASNKDRTNISGDIPAGSARIWPGNSPP